MQFILLAALLFWASSAKSAETIVVDQANPPFMYEIKGKVAGIYPALIREAFQRMGEDIQLSALPWKRALNDVDRGLVGIGGLYKTKTRVAVLDFSDRLFEEVIQIYVVQGKSFPYDGIRSLYGRKIGVLRGWSYGEEFDAAVAAGKIKIEEVSGDMQNFEKLAAGRLDIVLAIRESAEIVISSGGLKDKIEPLPSPLITSPAYLAFAKSGNKTGLLARFNTTLATMHGDGSYDRIVAAISSSD